jgi:hypothetical protein
MESDSNLFKLEVNQESLKSLLDNMMCQVSKNKSDVDLLNKQVTSKIDAHSTYLALQGACTDIQIPDISILKEYQKKNTIQRYGSTLSRNEINEIKLLFSKRFNELYFLAGQFDD